MLAEALSNGPQTVASAMALNLLQEALPDIRRAAGLAPSATAVSQDGRSEAVTIRTNTPPPPFRGALAIGPAGRLVLDRAECTAFGGSASVAR